MFQWILETFFREFSICFVQAVQLHTKYLKGKITKNVTESHTKYHEDLKRSNYHKHVHLPYFSLLFLILFNTVYSLQYTLQRSMSRLPRLSTYPKLVQDPRALNSRASRGI